MLGIAKTELQGLVAAGEIPKDSKDTYHRNDAVRAYVEFLRRKDSGPITQEDIAAHLDLSVRKVRDVLQKLKLDHTAVSMDIIRWGYIRNLRAVAAGHQSAGGADLTLERVLTERVDRQLKELTLQEKLGELVAVDDIQPMWDQMVLSARAEMLSVAEKLKTELDAVYDINVDADLINDYIHNALHRLADHAADSTEDAAPLDGEVQAATETDNN